MADRKVTQLDELSDWVDSDLLYIVDQGGPTSKKITVQNLLSWTPSGGVERKFTDKLEDFVSVKDYGALGDFAQRTDGTVTDGSAVLSSAGISFTSDDAGKSIWVDGASTSGTSVTNVDQAPIDAAWQFDDSEGTFVDETDDFNSSATADVDPFPATEAIGDRFYIGHVQTFNQVTITISTSGVGGIVQWKYWTGSAWSNLTVTDNTGGFTASPGSYTVTFTPPGDWATTQLNAPINGRRLYYIAAEITTVYATNPVLSQGVLSGGRIRVTSADHLIDPLQTISVKGVTGTTEANGTWQVERIGNDALDLIGSTFSNTYVSGGTVHGRLETTILSVASGDATLNANAGASISGTASFGYGTDDTSAIQAALDTEKTVIVPDGEYFTDQVVINTDGQKLLGMGGKLVALPASLSASDIDRYALVSAQANFVEIAHLYLDNPSLSNMKERPEWPFAINMGIDVSGFQCNVHHNIVRRFLDGIVVLTSTGGSTGPEYAYNIISNNIVWELLGSGSGDDNRIDNQGETLGDGIVSWGASTIITGNIVQARQGADCRIGIHVESLADRHDPVDFTAMYEDRGAVISNNIVLGHGLDVRNGRFRRGIVSEAVKEVSITGNVVYGGGWWGIAVIVGGSATEGRGNFSIVGNQVYWSRPAVDLSGDDWSPARSGIAAWSNTTGKITNVVIADNNIQNIGDIGTGIRISSFTGGSSFRDQVRITGNSVFQREGGLFNNSFIVASSASANELIVSNNTLKGTLNGGQALLRIQNAQERLVINGNIIVYDGSTTTFKCMELSGGSAVITGNHFDGGNDGVHLVNMDRVVFTGNIIENCTDDGLDMFGTTSAILSSNIIENVGGSYTTNYSTSAIKLDVDNVKN